jgi:ferric-dicitrate binding protein FerR (iron transport regulator)
MSMTRAKSQKEIQEAREILKPVLKAEKRLQKAAKALVIAKLALAHALVEANVESNATLAAWTDGVLSGNDATVKTIFDELTNKKTAKVKDAKLPAPLKVVTGKKPISKATNEPAGK